LACRSQSEDFPHPLSCLGYSTGTRVADIIDIFGRSLHVAWADDTLGDVLRELKKGRSHMALVRDVNNVDETQDPYYELKGLITLEDIIEEILGKLRLFFV
jgi:metal transporter CNNM